MKTYPTNEATIKAWIDGQDSGQNKTGSVLFEDRVLYSYGDHFPLGIKYGNLYLLNKDRYSATTSAHQNTVRELIHELKSLQYTINYGSTEELQKNIKGE